MKNTPHKYLLYYEKFTVSKFSPPVVTSIFFLYRFMNDIVETTPYTLLISLSGHWIYYIFVNLLYLINNLYFNNTT